MQLFILNPVGKTLACDFDENTLVKDIIEHTIVEENLSQSDIRLGFAGLELSWAKHAEKRLSELNVQQGSTLHLSLPLKGAATGGKAMKGKAKEVHIDPHTRTSIARAELKRKLEVEAKNSAVSKMKIQNQWRKIMRMTKTEALKKDIEILSQNHEREVDRKDAILQMLDRDLEEAEDQHLTMARTHLQHLDALMELYDSKLLALESEFNSELASITNEFETSKKVMLQKFNMEKQELLAIIAVVDQEEQDRENEAKQAHEQLCEEIKNKNLEEINMLRIGLDAQIEELEQQFEAAHLSYLQQTGQRTQEFKELTRNDQNLTKDIDVKRKTIDRLQGNIQQWRTKVMQLQRESDERTRVLKEEKSSIQKHYQQLKRRIAKFRQSQQQRLLTLTEASKRTKSTLSFNTQLAEDILRLYQHANDLETEQEQVLPFQRVLSAAAEEQMQTAEFPSDLTQIDNTTRMPYQTSLTSTTGDTVPPAERLRKFYQRMNQVTIDKAIIEKERDRLATENAQLQDLINQYLEGLTINPELLKADNPLLVINGRASLNRPLHFPKQPDQIFKQEAAYTLQHSESLMP